MDIQRAEHIGCLLSPLTIILDSRTNWKIFSNDNCLSASGEYQHLQNASLEHQGYSIVKLLGNLHPMLANHYYLILIIIAPPTVWQNYYLWQYSQRLTAFIWAQVLITLFMNLIRTNDIYVYMKLLPHCQSVLPRH